MIVVEPAYVDINPVLFFITVWLSSFSELVDKNRLDCLYLFQVIRMLPLPYSGFSLSFENFFPRSVWSSSWRVTIFSIDKIDFLHSTCFQYLTEQNWNTEWPEVGPRVQAYNSFPIFSPQTYFYMVETEQECQLQRFFVLLQVVALPFFLLRKLVMFPTLLQSVCPRGRSTSLLGVGSMSFRITMRTCI